ncbi:MAG: protein kinase [Gemmatimonadaceae bacterium]
MSDDLTSVLQAALGDAYALERELGGGGMSRVFLAEERALARQVVVKVLPPALAVGLSPDRFRREILLAARLQHPHIVPVLATGEAGGVPFFTMPFVEGRSLRERLASGEPIPVRETVRLLRDVAGALDYAHERGVIHRDIKPDNVLVSHGSAVVTDFGVAKAISSARDGGGTGTSSATLTALGTSLGTPAYMAPEQAAGDPAADHRVDLYAFGVLAYEMLAGAPPFAGRAPHALLVAHLTEVPPPLRAARPDVPAALAALVHDCLAKDPEARPRVAADLVARLDDVLASATGEGVIPSVPAAARAAPSSAAPAGASAGRAGSTLAGRRTRAVAGAVLGLAAVGSGAWFVLGRGRNTTAGAPAATSVAVLPFVNVGRAGQDEYFSDGMTDEITDALGEIPGLRVASRTSAFAFKGKNVDAREIGRALSVGSLLEGRVRREGDRLRVSAQLTGARDGLTLWSESYERRQQDVFAVQDDIARAIATALRLRLVTDEAGTTDARARHGTADLAAYDLYLRGRYHFHQRGAAALHKAADYFGQAIRRDTAYAEAYAGLADAMALLPVYGDTPADSAFRVAQQAADRAVALDSTLAEAHTTLGLVHKSVGRWADAERELRRAVALDPRYPPAHQWLSEVLIVTGRVQESLIPMRDAARLDPMSPVIQAELAYALGMAGDGPGADAAGRRGVELAPQLWTTHAFLGYAYLFTGRTADGLAQIETAAGLDSSVVPVLGTLAFAYAVAGQVPRARVLAARLARAGGLPGGSAMAPTIAYLGLGDREQALRWLERAAERRDSWLYAMSVNAPFFDPVRADPRFAAVVRGMGLDVERMTTDPRR